MTKSATDQLVDWLRPSDPSDVRELAAAIKREERGRIVEAIKREAATWQPSSKVYAERILRAIEQ